MLERYRYLIVIGGLVLLLLPRVPVIGVAGQRRLPRGQDRPARLPAGRVRQARDRHLPGQLPARAPRGPGRRREAVRRDHLPAAQAPRADARRLGSGDGDARLHPRPRQLADVLRRLPGADLHGDEPDLVRDHRPGDVPRRRLVLRVDRRPRRRPDRHLARSLPGRRAAPATRCCSRCSPRPTAGCSARASASRCCGRPGSKETVENTLIPQVQTDFIYALIVNELGLFGGCGVITIYALIAARGFKIASIARDGFSKLLAAGLTAVFALQAFVIIGGVIRVIPLTGVTLPLISYGGSSVIANFVLVALLLLISDRARRPEPGEARVNVPIRRLLAVVLILFALLVGFTSKWSVFDAEELRGEDGEQAPAVRGAADQARPDPHRRRRGDRQQRSRRARTSRSSTCASTRMGQPVRQPDRLQLHHPGNERVRAVRERDPDRRGERVRLDPRPDPRPARRRAATSSRPSTPAPSRSRPTSSTRPASPAPSSRSSRRPARSG